MQNAILKSASLVVAAHVRGHHVADKMTSTLILLIVMRKMRTTLSARFYMVNIVSTEWAKGIERELNEN